MDHPFQSPNVLSFCPGFLGLERGLERAIGKIKVISYVEIEAFICANLVAGMEAGILAPAPIWTDVKTFPAKGFRDKIHGIIGGYPCQPFSVVGHQKGNKDPRHLWPYILSHIETIRPVWCYFENVRAHLTLGYDEVYRGLSDAGYAVECGIFTAEEVGAPHERERLFILAIRKDYLEHTYFSNEWSIFREFGKEPTEQHVAGNRSDNEELEYAQVTKGERKQPIGNEQKFTGLRSSGENNEMGNAKGITKRKPADKAITKPNERRTRDESGNSGKLAHSGSNEYTKGHRFGRIKEETKKGKKAIGQWEWFWDEPTPSGKAKLAYPNNSGSLQNTKYCELRTNIAQQPSGNSWNGEKGKVGNSISTELQDGKQPGTFKNRFQQEPHGSITEPSDCCWPARPGQPQYGWEEPRVANTQIIRLQHSVRKLWHHCRKDFKKMLGKEKWQEVEDNSKRSTKSSLGRSIDGYNFREDLLRAYGNSVVEQTAELAAIKESIEENTIVIHGFMPRAEILKRNFSTEVVDVLESTFPIRLNVYNGKPLRNEMAYLASKLEAKVYVVGEIKEGYWKK